MMTSREQKRPMFFDMFTLLLAGALGFTFTQSKWKDRTNQFRAGEGCSEDSDCIDHELCIEGKCYQQCEDDGECPSWKECRSDLHPTAKVCGEETKQTTDSPFTPPSSNGDTGKDNQNDTPSSGEGMSTTQMIAIGGGIAAVAAIGIAAMTKKNKGGGE